MQEYIWPIIIIVVGIILTLLAGSRNGPIIYWDPIDYIGIVLIVAGFLLSIFNRTEYSETNRYNLKSYSITTIDTKQEQAQRCTAVLADGSTMIVDLREIRQEGDKALLVQYTDKSVRKRKPYYILLLPANEPAKSVPQQPETSMKKTSTDPHE